MKKKSNPKPECVAYARTHLENLASAALLAVEKARNSVRLAGGKAPWLNNQLSHWRGVHAGIKWCIALLPSKGLRNAAKKRAKSG